jgi:hypothetical protein
MEGDRDIERYTGLALNSPSASIPSFAHLYLESSKASAIFVVAYLIAKGNTSALTSSCSILNIEALRI